MFERSEAGFSAAKDCWSLLRQQKSLLLFPLLSCVSCILILIVRRRLNPATERRFKTSHYES